MSGLPFLSMQHARAIKSCLLAPYLGSVSLNFSHRKDGDEDANLVGAILASRTVPGSLTPSLPIAEEDSESLLQKFQLRENHWACGQAFSFLKFKGSTQEEVRSYSELRGHWGTLAGHSLSLS